MSQASVSNAKRRFEDTGSYRNRKCPGRPRLSTKRDDRFLERRSLKVRFKPATKLKEEWEVSMPVQVLFAFAFVVLT